MEYNSSQNPFMTLEPPLLQHQMSIFESQETLVHEESKNNLEQDLSENENFRMCSPQKSKKTGRGITKRIQKTKAPINRLRRKTKQTEDFDESTGEEAAGPEHRMTFKSDPIVISS